MAFLLNNAQSRSLNNFTAFSKCLRLPANAAYIYFIDKGTFTPSTGAMETRIHTKDWCYCYRKYFQSAEFLFQHERLICSHTM